MNVIEALKTRRSIRGYKPDPVPRQTIEKIIDAAIRSPSGMNTQPWEFHVITGRVLSDVTEENTRLFSSGTIPTTDMLSKPFEGIYRERQVALAKEIFRLMDISREDKEKRNIWMQRGFRYFDAPVAIIICSDREMKEHLDMLGIGALCQSICLAALEYGLGSCIADQGIMYPEVWHKLAGIPESKRIIAGICLGYPDWDFPANKLVSGREPLEKITTWTGWD